MRLNKLLKTSLAKLSYRYPLGAAFSNDFTLPPEACNSYVLLYKRLQEFEADLHTHIHLENNVLFPKALELEKRLESELVE